jgi:peptide/nickel transport system substrate-binding protein
LVREAEAEGVPTELTFSTTSDNQLRETLQQVVQQQLKEVGITVNIRNTAAQTFFGEWTVEGNFEMAEWAWVTDPDPQVTELFSADQLPPGGQNYYRYQNEEVTNLLKESDVAIDEDKRAQLIREAQQLMAEDLPLIPLYQRPRIYAYTQNLQGPEVNPTLAGPFWNIGKWSFSQ